MRPLNPLARKSPGTNPEAIDRLKAITRELLDLPEDVVVSACELSCCRPGCADVETVVALLAAGEKPRTVRFPKPLREINVVELAAALRAIDA
jgi:hypothetical protein